MTARPWTTLTGLQRSLAQPMAALDDSTLAAGSEAYSAALAYYQAVKGAARMKVQGAEAIANDLGERFPAGPGPVRGTPPA